MTYRRPTPLRDCVGKCGRKVRSWREHVYCPKCLPEFVGADVGWTRRLRAEKTKGAEPTPLDASPVTDPLEA
jgi:hypothetical protein